MLDLLLLIAGSALLYLGAEWLVGGSSSLAQALGMSPLMVGLTVVAYGTSAPEVIVGIDAASQGHGSIALGNALGSNMANLGLILGVTAVIRPPRADAALGRRDLPVLVASTLVLPLLLVDAHISLVEAALLLTGAVAYTIWMARSTLRMASAAQLTEGVAVSADAAQAAGAPAGRSRLRMLVVAGVGLALLIIGGDAFVTGASGVATALGVDERLIGMTVVALGTSLPELATSIVAARRGHADIATGNVVGSNIFNVLLGLGTAAVAGPIRTPLRAAAPELGFLIGLTLLASSMMRTERVVTRAEGTLLLLTYAGFVLMLVA